MRRMCPACSSAETRRDAGDVAAKSVSCDSDRSRGEYSYAVRLARSTSSARTTCCRVTPGSTSPAKPVVFGTKFHTVAKCSQAPQTSLT